MFFCPGLLVGTRFLCLGSNQVYMILELQLPSKKDEQLKEIKQFYVVCLVRMVRFLG